MGIFRLRSRLMATHPFVHRSALVQNEYLLQPVNECLDQRTENFFRFTVIKSALFVALDSVVVPPNHKLIRKHALIVKRLHKRI